jgi:hypothetical protein
MITNRRSKRSSASRRKRKPHAGNLPHASTEPHTRTSLIGTTIYLPDIEPSPRGRKLLEALDSIYRDQLAGAKALPRN